MTKYQTTFVNYAHRLALNIAYRLMCLFWSITKTPSQGALIAVWVDDKILLVRNSYRPSLTLPGGYIHPGEDPKAAARRELEEETGLSIAENQLRFVQKMTQDYNGRSNTNFVYECLLSKQPKLTVDQREVIEAGFFSMEHAADLDLLDVVHSHLDYKLKHELCHFRANQPPC
jgi:ADP-ribose pyrophosphatase YjhB (NUDIX family)